MKSQKLKEQIHCINSKRDPHKTSPYAINTKDVLNHLGAVRAQLYVKRYI